MRESTAVKLPGGCYLAEREELTVIPTKELNIIPFRRRNEPEEEAIVFERHYADAVAAITLIILVLFIGLFL